MKKECKKLKKIILYTIGDLKILQRYNSIEDACKNLEVSSEEFMAWKIKGISPKGFIGFGVSYEVSYRAALANKKLQKL